MKNYNGKDFFEEQYYPIINAIDESNIRDLETLINDANKNIKGKHNLTLVFYSFLKNKKDIFSFFLNKGVDVNQPFEKSEGDTTHIINIAAKLDDDFYFDKLVGIAKLEVKDERGLYPIHDAIMVNNNKRVLQMLEMGANINIQDKNGKTPVYMLCALNYFEFAFMLIEKGANPKIPNNTGSTVALIIQESNFPVTTKAYKWQQKIKEELIKQGVVFPVKRPWEK
jgi:ankyrin repeat protein